MKYLNVFHYFINTSLKVIILSCNSQVIEEHNPNTCLLRSYIIYYNRALKSVAF